MPTICLAGKVLPWIRQLIIQLKELMRFRLWQHEGTAFESDVV